jgi:transglutaminase-like putative cysteine protease
MPIFTVRHVTTYHYKRPVAFGEHRMMLRPRDDEDQKVLETKLEIRPEPSELSWTRDVFGNHVTTARFENRAPELRFESTIRLDHTPAGFGEADIEEFARTYPFAYGADERDRRILATFSSTWRRPSTGPSSTDRGTTKESRTQSRPSNS